MGLEVVEFLLSNIHLSIIMIIINVLYNQGIAAGGGGGIRYMIVSLAEKVLRIVQEP